MKSMCHDARRNSPSVAACRPTSSCIFTIARIASSSSERSSAASILPAARSSRAWSRWRGRSRLPTWSARKGGVVRSDTVRALLGLGVNGVGLELDGNGDVEPFALDQPLDVRTQLCELLQLLRGDLIARRRKRDRHDLLHLG